MTCYFVGGTLGSVGSASVLLGGVAGGVRFGVRAGSGRDPDLVDRAPLPAACDQAPSSRSRRPSSRSEDGALTEMVKVPRHRRT